jgi:hypothetical protein
LTKGMNPRTNPAIVPKIPNPKIICIAASGSIDSIHIQLFIPECVQRWVYIP